MAVCVGCGLAVNGASGLLEAQLRPGGCLSCDPDGADAGLFVEISPDACNGSECRANGLYSPCPDSLTGIDGSTSTQATPVVVVADAVASNEYIFPATDTLSITNTLCCNIHGMVRVVAGGIKLGTGDPGLLIEGFLEISTNGGAYIGASPGGSRLAHNNSTTEQLWADFNNIVDNLWLAPTAPTVVTTYHARMRYVVSPNAAVPGGTLSGAQLFEYDFTMTQTGCC